MKSKILFVVIFSLTMVFVAKGQTPLDVHRTKYDWSLVAEQIAGDKTSKHDQAYAIYRWLCDNISYDITYSIYDADTAFEQKRGVCQAYCEMFYRIAEPLGLKVHVISGKSKDHDGKVGEIGHAWLFVFIDGNSGILVDPTWGAGSVNGNLFKKSEGDDSWFQVDPKWMIFTHFPDDKAYQLLDSPIGYDTFLKLKPLFPMLGYYGFNPSEILCKSLAGEAPDIPECFFPKNIIIDEMPHEATLRVGKTYSFILGTEKQHEFAIVNGNDFDTDWLSSGNWYKTDYVPSGEGTLSLCYRDKGADGNWTTLVEYKVDKATPDDIAALEKLAPEKSPCLQGLENYYPEILKAKNVDFVSLLEAVRREGIRKLPVIYTNGSYSLNSVPMNGELAAGKTYTFAFSPYEEGDWVLVNGGVWLRNWVQDPETRAWVMTFEAAQQGSLKLVFKPKGSTDNSYSVFMEYAIR